MKDFLSRREVCAELGIGLTTLAKMINHGLPVCPLADGSRIYRIKREDLIAYIESRRRQVSELEIPEL